MHSLDSDDVLVVVDIYQLPTFVGGGLFLAIAFVCKHGLKDCYSNDFFFNTEPIGDIIG